MSDKENSAPKKSRFRTARGWVAFACVAFALAGMAFRVGIGTPSAFGVQQISAICPLGALETMAGAKGVMLHPLLLFVLVVVLIALVGKAFCAWTCPVPWLQKFFRPKKRGAAKGGVGRDARRRAGRAWRSGFSQRPRCGFRQVEPSAAGAAQAVEFGEERAACAPSACAACAGAAACAKAPAPVGRQARWRAAG